METMSYYLINISADPDKSIVGADLSVKGYLCLVSVVQASAVEMLGSCPGLLHHMIVTACPHGHFKQRLPKNRVL